MELEQTAGTALPILALVWLELLSTRIRHGAAYGIGWISHLP